MTDDELKKLKRTDLLEMLITQSQENESLQNQLKKALKQLQSRKILIENSGSIAEAALKLNGVFRATEAACAQYQENIERLSGEQTEICRKMQEESEQKAAALLASSKKEAAELLEETQKKCRKMESETQQKCTEMLTQAKTDSEKYWSEISQKLEDFCRAHEELRQLVDVNLKIDEHK